MYLGIMIALFIWGIMMLLGNYRRNDTAMAIGYSIGLLSTLVGFCGAVGWLWEVFSN